MLIRNNASNLILRLGQIQTNSVYSMNIGVNYLGLTEKVLPLSSQTWSGIQSQLSAWVQDFKHFFWIPGLSYTSPGMIKVKNRKKHNYWSCDAIFGKGT